MSSRRSRLALGAVVSGVALAAALFLLPGAPPERATQAAGTVSANGFTLSASTIALPVDDVALPERPGIELVRANCTACHSAAMLTQQPPLTAKQWQAVVEKMQKVYRAPIPAGDVPGIVGYLVGMGERQ